MRTVVCEPVTGVDEALLFHNRPFEGSGRCKRAGTSRRLTWQGRSAQRLAAISWQTQCS